MGKLLAGYAKFGASVPGEGVFFGDTESVEVIEPVRLALWIFRVGFDY